MPRLPNFPLANQLADTTEVNREYDCVPTSIAACLEFLTGKHEDGALVKDAVYGRSYEGGTAARAYVDYCKAQGVTLFALDGQPAQLISDIIAQLKLGHPLVITEPDPYANPNLGWSHVVAMCGFDETVGTLTAMDPFGGKFITRSFKEWQARLEFNEVWALELENDMAITTNDPAFTALFTRVDDQHYKNKAGKVLQLGNLAFYLKENGPARLGDALSSEIETGGGTSYQVFERGVIVYTPAGGSAFGDIYSGPAWSAAVGSVTKDLNQQIATLTQELATARQQGNPAAEQALQQIIAIVKPLEQA